MAELSYESFYHSNPKEKRSQQRQPERGPFPDVP